MTPVYLRLTDLSDRAREDMERIAQEWLGDNPWSVCGDTTIPGWWDDDELDDQPAIPLHLGAGADLARIILATWPHPGRGTCEWRLATPTRLRAALLAAAPE